MRAIKSSEGSGTVGHPKPQSRSGLDIRSSQRLPSEDALQNGTAFNSKPGFIKPLDQLFSAASTTKLAGHRVKTHLRQCGPASDIKRNPSLQYSVTHTGRCTHQSSASAACRRPPSANLRWHFAQCISGCLAPALSVATSAH